MFVLLVYTEYQENLSNIFCPDKGCTLITLKSFLHFFSAQQDKLCSMSCSTDHTQAFCNLQLVSQTPGVFLAGLRSCAISLPWEAGSHMEPTSLAVLTYHRYISFHLAGFAEEHIPHSLLECQEPFLTAGLPTSRQDCTSLPHIPSRAISSWGLYRDVLFPRKTSS